MSNIKSLLAKYKEVLLAKSLQDLQIELQSLGGPKLKNRKAEIIAKILSLTESNQQHIKYVANTL